MNQIEIIKPDDWHVHFRDGEFLNKVVPETSKHFARGIIMPNLVPPILNQKNAIDYKNRIKNAIPKNHDFDPLMTLYLTDNTSEKELKNSFLQNSVFAAKLYPAGATTNSDSGVTNIDKIMNLLEIMSEIGMPLLIHGESTHREVDIFDREKVFIDNTLDYICRNLPNLKITLEHITTKEATQYVLEGNENLEELEKNCALRESLERLRLKCGKIMKLGNVKEKTVPKMTIVSKPLSNGMINTRTFIPHKCHHSIGVFGAISVATACLIEDTPANKLSLIPSGEKKLCAIEHPSGKMEVLAELSNNKIISTAILRTARKLFDGVVFSNNDGLKAS